MTLHEPDRFANWVPSTRLIFAIIGLILVFAIYRIESKQVDVNGACLSQYAGPAKLGSLLLVAWRRFRQR